MKIKTVIGSMILLVLLFTIIPNMVHAEDKLTLQYVVFKMEDNSLVRTTMGDYGRAFSAAAGGTQNLLWNTLRGSKSKPTLVGVGSGNKYITMGEYGRKYSGMITKNIDLKLGLNASQITSEGLKASDPIAESIVSTYKEVIYTKDINGNIIGLELAPIIPPVTEFKVVDIY